MPTRKQTDRGAEVKKDIVEQARICAANYHYNQRRKYTDQTYIHHTCEVAMLVESVGCNDNIIAAAHLHDTLEDTNITLKTLLNTFGREVTNLVMELTDTSLASDGNREARKRIDRKNLANASIEAKTIKLAALISNTASILRYDPDFAEIYMEEKRLLLPHLKEGNDLLFKIAGDILCRNDRIKTMSDIQIDDIVGVYTKSDVLYTSGIVVDRFILNDIDTVEIHTDEKYRNGRNEYMRYKSRNCKKL